VNSIKKEQLLLFFFSIDQAIQEAFLKRPEEGKLPEYKPIEQEKEVVDGQYHHPIQDGEPCRMTFVEKPGCNDWLDKHHRKACAGKDDEDNDDLPGSLDLPAGLKFSNPLWCGHYLNEE